LISAGKFIASVGVNVLTASHFAPYQNLAAVETGLNYVGIKTLRAVALPNTASYETLASHGFSFDFTVPNNFVSPSGSVDLPGTLNYLSGFQSRHPGAIAFIEGANEFESWPVTYNGQTGFDGAAALQRALFAGVNSTPNLKDVTVLNLTMGLKPGQGAEAYAPLGDLSNAADDSNAHLYFNGQPSRVGWDTLSGISQASTRGLPHLVITETGYSSAYNDASNRSVSELDQAKLTLNSLMMAAKRGVDATFLYQLVDHEADPTHSIYEDGLGLFRSDWTAKPVADALHNLTTILGDEAAAATATANVTYSLSGMPTTAQDVLFQESDHIFDLVLWNDVDVWNEASRTENTIAPKSVTVQLDHPYASVKVFDPLLGTTAILDAGATGTVTVSLTDHPLIIEFKDIVASAASAVGYYASDVGSTAAKVFRVYEAALGREPDSTGLANWVKAIDAGASLQSVASGFIGSPEFVDRFGAGDDGQFVTLLYNNVLGRDPDASGLQNWLDYIRSGHSRAEVVIGFSESAEHVASTAPEIQQGLWVGNPNAARVARLYDTVLDRLPDQGGLTTWAMAMQAGKSLQTVADGFVASSEFQAKYGTLDNGQFVQQLYQNVLGRPADDQGLSSWTAYLNSGHSRAEVVVGFSESSEHISLTAPYIDHGIVFG
jgi:hypothetical protein